MILRVFPQRTNQTPTDGVVGFPGLFRKPADEVHISVTFTWDIPYAERLQKNWASYYPVVKIGGPAYGDPGGEFTPGRYIKKGIVFTSRGCPNKCDFCLVPEREGNIREIEIKEGNIVQDNNLLACSRGHVERVFQMLRGQKKVVVAGIEAGRVRPWFVDLLRSVSLHEVWIAFDSWAKEKSVKRAREYLKDFTNRKVRCYVLIGRDGIESDTARLELAWEIGCDPFAQLYQPPLDAPIVYDKAYRSLARKWSRPALYRQAV